MLTISFVIPFYNERSRLERTFHALERFTTPQGVKLDKVIFVDDGSSDGSALMIRKFVKRVDSRLRVVIVSLHENSGKGAAIRKGMKLVDSNYGLFFDADISTPLEEVKNFVADMRGGVDVIVGTRKNGKSTVLKHQPIYREYLGKVFTRVSQLMFGIPVSDVTCGFKAYSKEAINQIFDKAFIDGWAFGLELLLLARNLGLSITERSVLWSDDRRSKVKLWQAIPEVLGDVCKVMWSHHLRTILPVKLPDFSTSKN